MLTHLEFRELLPNVRDVLLVVCGGAGVSHPELLAMKEKVGDG